MTTAGFVLNDARVWRPHGGEDLQAPLDSGSSLRRGLRAEGGTSLNPGGRICCRGFVIFRSRSRGPYPRFFPRGERRIVAYYCFLMRARGGKVYVRLTQNRVSEGNAMTLWVDADACPGAVKELIIRTAGRLKICTVFVANKYISVPESIYVSSCRIGMEPEAVDQHITQHARAGDLVVTQDIPLASALVAMGVIVMGLRGELFTENNIGERLAIRNFMQDIREAGGITPGPKGFGQRDKQRFSDTLDRELTKCMKRKRF